MRHKRVGRKLGVTSKHRKSMFRNMATDLLRHDRIKTSDVRAKEIRRVVEKLITLAKKGTLESRRKAEGFIRDKEVVKKLFTDIAEKFKDRPGGYTRIVKLGFRKGDNTPISLIELIDEEYKPKKKRKKRKPKAKAVEKSTDDSAKSSKKESAEDLGLVEAGAASKAADEVVEKVEEIKEPEVKETEKDVAPEAAKEVESDNAEEPEAKTEDVAAEAKESESENSENEEVEAKKSAADSAPEEVTEPDEPENDDSDSDEEE